ncbi:hypothetical protein [Labedaea rhizosphaerae]|uniref:hypothetical protein n=1 Tax=Labedaea rhizosphaerae TaxID=598644 RepID=UPI00105F6134|nr:hypothetical protein [Labedaea rhizosphaerae]
MHPRGTRRLDESGCGATVVSDQADHQNAGMGAEQGLNPTRVRVEFAVHQHDVRVQIANGTDGRIHAAGRATPGKAAGLANKRMQAVGSQRQGVHR